VLSAVLGATLFAQVPAGPGPELPAGAGVEVLRARCVSCHGSDLITSQRLGEAGWGRELDKMVRWGAVVPDAERGPLVAYLARHFAPGPAASHSAVPAGEAVFTRACLACHGADLTEQQRLSPAGWTREVEKMMRWGAQVSETEKAALVEYLAARYPVR
jgi:mono/diheme cytochrome c family protein